MPNYITANSIVTMLHDVVAYCYNQEILSSIFCTAKRSATTFSLKKQSTEVMRGQVKRVRNAFKPQNLIGLRLFPLRLEFQNAT